MKPQEGLLPGQATTSRWPNPTRLLTAETGAGWLLLAGVLWVLATIWTRPLLLPDEGRYVGVAAAMVHTGDWLTPALDGLPYFHKPPLFYWITALSLSTLGMSEAAARMGSLGGALMMQVALFLFLRRRTDAATARNALLVLVTSPFTFGAAQYANLDMLLAGCVTVTIVLAAEAALRMREEAPSRALLLGAYAFAGFGILAKGMIGLLLPAMVLGAWLLLERNWRVLLRMGFSPLGWILLLAITAPWFIAMEVLHPGFLHYFFVVQHFQRYVGTNFNNPQPLYFCAVVLLVLMLPWSIWVMRAGRKGLGSTPSIRHLLLIWFGVVLVFFSLPKSKLVGYVLPALPAAAALLGSVTARLPSRTRLSAAGIAVAVASTVMVALAFRPMPSWKAAGDHLAAHRQPGDVVVALGFYPFDLPFYAGTADPILVVDDWEKTRRQTDDNWRKELADTRRFDAQGAARVLISDADLDALLCGPQRLWIAGREDALQGRSGLRTAERVASGPAGSLWRSDADRRPAEACAGRASP